MRAVRVAITTTKKTLTFYWLNLRVGYFSSHKLIYRYLIRRFRDPNFSPLIAFQYPRSPQILLFQLATGEQKRRIFLFLIDEA